MNLASAAPAWRDAACVVFNAGSGAGRAAALAQEVETALAARGVAAHLFPARSGAELPGCADAAVAAAARDSALVVAIGGDGTLNTVAQALVGRPRPLGVLAAGTFNYFARVHGLPMKAAEAVDLWAGAGAQPVQTGRVNEQVFLVNASLGLFPKILRAREADNARLGRRRLVAAWAALRTLLAEQRVMRLAVPAARQVWRTPTLFVGNNPLQLQQVGVDLPEQDVAAVGTGTLAALRVQPVPPWKLVALALRALLPGALRADEVKTETFTRLVVQPLSRRGRPIERALPVAYDGEVRAMAPPFEFSVGTEPLWLIKP